MAYVKIDRKLLNNSIWAETPYSKGQAWIDLIMLANYETKYKKWRGKDICFKRGTVNLSMQYLADRWGWSRGRARAYIDMLVEKEMIEIKTYNRQRTVITIKNYDKYQDVAKEAIKKNPPETSGTKAEEKKKDDIDWDNVTN